MSRFMSLFAIFSICKKSNISNPTVFVGGANSRRWGRAGPSRRRLAQPAPDPAGDIFRITGPSPTRSVRFQSLATSARPGQRVSNLTGRLPGLAREILKNIFAVSSCCVSSSSRFRGSNVLVSPGAATESSYGRGCIFWLNAYERLSSSAEEFPVSNDNFTPVMVLAF